MASSSGSAQVLTHEELFKYRTTTYLLSQLDGLNNKHGSVEDLIPQIVGRRADAETLEMLTYLARALVRGPEILAITVSGLNKLTIVANPRLAEWKNLPPHPTLPEKAFLQPPAYSTLSVSVAPQHQRVITGKNAVAAVEGMMGENVPFHDHVEMTLALLKAHHTAEGKEQDMLFDVMSIYIFSASIEKIEGNLQRGMDGEKPRVHKNFWDILTCDWETLEVGFNEAADKVLPFDLDDTTLMTKRRQERLHAYYGLNTGNNKVFDAEGRQRLRKMLRAALLQIQDVVWKIRSSNGKQRREMFLAGHNACKPFRMFSLLLECFANELSKVLRWIQEVFNVTSSDAVDGDPWHHTNRRSDQKITEKSHKIKLEDIDTKKSITQSNSEAEDEEDDDDDQAAIESESNWSKAVWSYLQLCCSHEDSLSQLRKSRSTNPEGFSPLCQTLKYSVITLKPDYKEFRINQTYPVESLLKEMYAGHEEFLEEVIAMFKQLGINTAVETTPGIWNPATTLLSLYALILDDIEAGTVSENSISATINSISGDVSISPENVSNLKNMRPLIAMSKRCSPSCKNLIDILNDHPRFNTNAPILHTGVHSKWSIPVIPIWLPRKYAEKLFEVARNELYVKIKDEKDRKRKRSASLESVDPAEEHESRYEEYSEEVYEPSWLIEGED